MDDSDSPLKYNPFATLGELLKDKVVLRPVPIKKPAVPFKKPDVSIKKQVVSTKKQVTEPAEAGARSVNEESAFQEAMQGVKPVVRDKHHAKKNHVANPLDHPVLDHLVKYGEGFIISKTPEYMEGTGRDIPPEFAERLHRGDFSIQAHIDLHGMGAAQAKDAFENFLNEAIRSGKGAVLIIHGRGISSPGEPVLKNKVSEWLTRSHWRKWVIAFTSAQSYDGGAGATYILLRHRLTSKRPRKKLTEK
jgi:DNA-nicking Smr family endonuclease